MQFHESRSNLSQMAKRTEKNSLHLKSFLARSIFYDRAYPQKFSTASPIIPLGATKTSELLLFVHPDKKFLKSS